MKGCSVPQGFSWIENYKLWQQKLAYNSMTFSIISYLVLKMLESPSKKYHLLSRELGGRGNPRFPTAVVESFFRDLLPAINTYWESGI